MLPLVPRCHVGVVSLRGMLATGPLGVVNDLRAESSDRMDVDGVSTA